MDRIEVIDGKKILRTTSWRLTPNMYVDKICNDYLLFNDGNQIIGRVIE